MPKRIEYTQHFEDHNQIISYSRGALTFVYNFSPDKAQKDFYVKVPSPGRYKVVLNTDEGRFGGYERISKSYVYTAEPKCDGSGEFKIFLPARCGIVIKKTK